MGLLINLAIVVIILAVILYKWVDEEFAAVYLIISVNLVGMILVYSFSPGLAVNIVILIVVIMILKDMVY